MTREQYLSIITHHAQNYVNGTHTVSGYVNELRKATLWYLEAEFYDKCRRIL